MANIYVATAWGNRMEARRIMRKLTEAGHTVTHDWTIHDAPAADLDNAYRERCGKDDYRGVMRADAVVLIAHPEMRDALAEMGIAIGAGKTVLVLNSEARHSVFYGLTQRIGEGELLDALGELWV